MSEQKIQKRKLITSSQLAKSSSEGKLMPLPENDSINSDIAVVNLFDVEKSNSNSSLHGFANGRLPKHASYTGNFIRRDSSGSLYGSVISNG